MAKDKTTKRKYTRRNKQVETAAKTKKNIPVETAEEIDIRETAKQMKLALKQIAKQMAELPAEKRAKKAKSIAWMGYAVNTTADGTVVARFVADKTKKSAIDAVNAAAAKTEAAIDAAKEAFSDNDDDNGDTDKADKEDEEPKVELVPAGDLLGSDGYVDEAEIANLDSDEEENLENEDNEYPDDDDDDSIFDNRDETDEELVANRKEYFSMYGDGDDE